MAATSTAVHKHGKTSVAPRVVHWYVNMFSLGACTAPSAAWRIAFRRQIPQTPPPKSSPWSRLRGYPGGILGASFVKGWYPFSLLNLHFLPFWPFWAPISLRCGLFGLHFSFCGSILAFGASTLAFWAWRRGILGVSFIKGGYPFSLLGLHFLPFWPFLGFQFLAFWHFGPSF